MDTVPKIEWPPMGKKKAVLYGSDLIDKYYSAICWFQEKSAPGMRNIQSRLES